ncbi:MAG: hypothetical protein GY795_07635 [Desulfobacterales bacterium]|nr:hypothetical protein [Desulfobacterales bacterium]
MQKKYDMYKKYIIIILLLMNISMFAWAYDDSDETESVNYLQSVEIFNGDKKKLTSYTSIELQGKNSIKLEGKFYEPLHIVIHPYPGITSKFIVERQYETSLTLSGEGPHVDLLKWKHFISDWKLLSRIENNIFQSNIVSSSEFPKVKTGEIVQAVKAVLKGYKHADGWIGLAKKCKGPNNYPCRVGVSKIRLKISVIKKNKKLSMLTIVYDVPMGC